MECARGSELPLCLATESLRHSTVSPGSTTMSSVHNHRDKAELHHDNLSVHEQQNTTEIRSFIRKQGGSTEGIDDATLMRFLTACCMSVEKAGRMFADFRNWRETFLPKGFVSDEEVRGHLDAHKVFLQGSSKRGWPLLVVLLSKHLPVKRAMENMKRFIVHCLDKAIASAPQNVEKVLIIVDLNHFGYKNIDIKGFISCFQFLQKYYPERLGRLYMVNPPQLFWNAWRLVSGFVDDNTSQKIQFLHSYETADVLLAEVDKDVLPTTYGGRSKLILLQDVHIQNHLLH